MLLRNKGRRTAPETSPPPVVSSVDALQKIVQMLRDPEKLVKLGENESGAIEAYGMLCLPPTELRATLMQMCDGLMVVAGLLLAVSAMMLFASPTKNHDENSTLFFVGGWFSLLSCGFFISCIFVCNGFSRAVGMVHPRRIHETLAPLGFSYATTLVQPMQSGFVTLIVAMAIRIGGHYPGYHGMAMGLTFGIGTWVLFLNLVHDFCVRFAPLFGVGWRHHDKGFLFMALMWSGLRDNRAELLARANAEARMVADEIEESAGLMRRDDRVPVDTTVVGE